MSALAIASFLHEDLAVPDVESVPDAVPPLAALVAEATGAVGELPPPPFRSTPAGSSEMPSAAYASSRDHASLGVFTSPLLCVRRRASACGLPIVRPRTIMFCQT